MSNKIVKNDLQRLIKFFSKYKWTKKAFARKANGGTACSAFEKEARCFCLMGAMDRIKVNDLTRSYLYDQLNLNAPGTAGITGFNDAPTTTKKDIMDLLNNSLKNLK